MKGSRRFVNYKRDLLTEDRIAEIESRRDDLKKMIKAKDLEGVKEASKQVRKVCEKSLSHYREPSGLAENVEVFWVAIVVALGIRAYFLQPFKIPTGSMQPSLNGIIVEDKTADPNWKKPWLGAQLWDFCWSGKLYDNKVAKRDLTVREFKDASIFLFSKTRVIFDDGSSISIGATVNEVMSADTFERCFDEDPITRRKSLRPGPHFKAGEVIFKGSVTSGDLVLVDKVSYHFRQPKRGESIVFDTRGINTGQPGEMSSQAGGEHYIKRLAGVPGDRIRIKNPDLYINGSLANEKGLKRVMEKGKDAIGRDYRGYFNQSRGGPELNFRNPNFEFQLPSDDEVEDRNQREFFALGDNSESSLDSRYWGTVKQYNLVGPAFISLWPFGSGHWGRIE